MAVPNLTNNEFESGGICMKRYILTLKTEYVSFKIDPYLMMNELISFRADFSPIFEKNKIGYAKLMTNINEVNKMKYRIYVYILYAYDKFDVSMFDELKDKYTFEIEPFDDIKKYNGYIFKHNKDNIDEFLRKWEDIPCCIIIDEKSHISFDILRYDDFEIEGYFGNSFDYSINISDAMVEKFAKKYDLELAE